MNEDQVSPEVRLKRLQAMKSLCLSGKDLRALIAKKSLDDYLQLEAKIDARIAEVEAQIASGSQKA